MNRRHDNLKREDRDRRRQLPINQSHRLRLSGKAFLRVSSTTPSSARSRVSSESISIRETYFAVYCPRETRLNLPLLISVWFTIVRNEGEVVMYPAF